MWHNIIHSLGYQNTLTKVAKMQNFWRHDRISEQQFNDEAETGDILLFRGKSAGAKFMRVLTRSQYDHVGVIFRDVKDNLFLLEATGVTGVDLLS